MGVGAATALALGATAFGAAAGAGTGAPDLAAAFLALASDFLAAFFAAD